jgi:hypothetical protein
MVFKAKKSLANPIARLLNPNTMKTLTRIQTPMPKICSIILHQTATAGFSGKPSGIGSD